VATDVPMGPHASFSNIRSKAQKPADQNRTGSNFAPPACLPAPRVSARIRQGDEWGYLTNDVATDVPMGRNAPFSNIRSKSQRPADQNGTGSNFALPARLPPARERPWAGQEWGHLCLPAQGNPKWECDVLLRT
jgi:hypothetical protein